MNSLYWGCRGRGFESRRSNQFSSFKIRNLVIYPEWSMVFTSTFGAISSADFIAENKICDSRVNAAGCRSCCKTGGRGRSKHPAINDKHQLSMLFFCCLCSRQAVIMPALVINIMPTQPLVVGQTSKITLPQIAANSR